MMPQQVQVFRRYRVLCFLLALWAGGLSLVSGQIPETAQAAKEILETRSDAMVILAIVAGLAGIWLWKVVIPERIARREMNAREQEARIESDKKQQEIAETQAATIAALGQATASIHSHTLTTYEDVSILVSMSEAQIECFEQLANVAKCDIRSQVGRMRKLLATRKTS
jgi:heme/copper-type cytochrome/quinol oxidase subunit 2